MRKNRLGDVMRVRREALALSQRELAFRVGVQPTHIGYIESGQRRPSLPLLERIGDVLGVDPRDLFLLSRPDARRLIQPAPEPGPPKRRDDAWQKLQ